MKEIFVNGVEFRYKSERDLSLILKHARHPARLKPLCELVQQVRRQRNLANGFSDVEIPGYWVIEAARSPYA